MTTLVSAERVGFRERRTAAIARRSSLPLEPACEHILSTLEFSLQAEIRPFLHRFANPQLGGCSVAGRETSLRIYLRGLARLSDVVSATIGRPCDLRTCASAECLAILRTKVESGEYAPVSLAMSLAAVRMFMNLVHKECPNRVGRLQRKFLRQPPKSNDHRVGDRETYVAGAAALGALHEVFAMSGRHRAWRLARDAALLAFEACVPLRRDEIRLVNVGHVAVRRSNSGATFLTLKVRMQKVGRSRIAAIRDPRAVGLLLSQLNAPTDWPLFRGRAETRLSNGAVYTILSRLGCLAFGERGGPNIFRKVQGKSAASLKEAAVGLGHAAKDEAITKRHYRGCRREQGLLLIGALGMPGSNPDTCSE